MGLDAKHPEYATHYPDWIMMRDFYAGERRVKSKNTDYLPATQGMIIDGMGSKASSTVKNVGQEAYDAYLTRALFPDYVKEAVEAYIGLLHQKAPTIRLPKQLEHLRTKASLFGESLEMLIRRVNEEQLISGRIGLFLDLPANAVLGAEPYIATYVAESMGNWDENALGEGPAKLNLVVLDESTTRRNANFDWIPYSKYRVLMLETNQDEQGNPIGEGSYKFGVFMQEGTGSPTFVPTDMKTAMWRGVGLSEIPFVFVNAKDITSEPDEPPLMGLARLCRAIYCGEADLRQNLFMQGQDTLVLAGERKKPADAAMGDSALRTGAGSMIEMEQGGTAQYVGVTANGLAEQRATLQDDHQRASSRSGQLINTKANGVESGDALKTRVAAQTATLVLIAKTSASAVETLLKIAAKWAGADPEEVKVDPNLEFSDYDMTGDNLTKLMTARKEGAPISKESIHGLMADQGLTRMDFKTEMETIKKEDIDMPPQVTTPAPGAPGSQTKPEPKNPAAGLEPKT